MIAAAGRKPRVLAYAERTSSLQSRGAPRRAALARIAALLTLLAIALLFGVSAMLLYHLGYTYESPGGSILEKMHPGSLAAILTVPAFVIVPNTLSLTRYGETLTELLDRKDEIIADHHRMMEQQKKANPNRALVDVLSEVLDTEDETAPCVVCHY